MKIYNVKSLPLKHEIKGTYTLPEEYLIIIDINNNHYCNPGTKWYC